MKNLLIIFCLTSLFFNTVATENGVPKAVQQSITEMYPTIKTPFWEKGNDSIIALFSDEKGFKKVKFGSDGKWMETLHRLDMLELPELVRLFVINNYDEGEVSFSGKVTSLEGEWYRVESEFFDRIVLNNLDANGVLLNQKEINFNFPNQIPHRIPNMAPKLLPVRLILPVK